MRNFTNLLSALELRQDRYVEGERFIMMIILICRWLIYKKELLFKTVENLINRHKLCCDKF